MIVDGYHGTTRDRAESIIQTSMRESQRDGLWLGTGRYFFQDARSLALHWASKEIRRLNLTNPPAVVHARIDLSHCIDLADNIFWTRVKEVYEDIAEGLTSRGIIQLGFEANLRALTADEQTRLGRNVVDAQVMTAARQSIVRDYRTLGVELTAIRAAFAEGQPVHPTSWLFDESNIMICVIDPTALVSPLTILE